MTNTTSAAVIRPLEQAFVCAADSVLMEAVARGDATAFQTLLERHLGRVVAVAQRIVQSRNEAEDIAQDVFLKLWQQPLLYDGDRAHFTTWLHRVIVNRAIDITRRHRPDPLADDFEGIDQTPTAIEQLLAKEDNQALYTALSTLPVRQRAALALAYQSDLPDKEAARAMQVSVKAYESLLVRGRRTLRELLLKGGRYG